MPCAADSIFVAPFLHTARLLSSVPNSQTKSTIRVLAYRLDTVGKLNSFFLVPLKLSYNLLPAKVLQEHPLVGNCGVMHSFDLPYLFNLNDMWNENSEDAKTSAAIGEDFLTFARDGRVQGWPLFDPQSPKARIYGTNGSTESEDLTNFRKEESNFWFKVIEAKASSTVEKVAFKEVQTT